jgi:hypothetical protein
MVSLGLYGFFFFFPPPPHPTPHIFVQLQFVVPSLLNGAAAIDILATPSRTAPRLTAKAPVPRARILPASMNHTKQVADNCHMS